MKALLSRLAGGPETLTLEEVAEPVPGRGEVRVAVRACSVNFPDVLMIRDLYQFKPPRPFSPGSELARTPWMPWERCCPIICELERARPAVSGTQWNGRKGTGAGGAVLEDPGCHALR